MQKEYWHPLLLFYWILELVGPVAFLLLGSTFFLIWPAAGRQHWVDFLEWNNKSLGGFLVPLSRFCEMIGSGWPKVGPKRSPNGDPK